MFSKLNRYIKTAKHWFSNPAEKALDTAYEAALTIRAIENEHFNGGKISAESSDYGSSVLTYFQTELNTQLRIIKKKLKQFKSANRSVFAAEKPTIQQSFRSDIQDRTSSFYGLDNWEKSSVILEKLKFIDEVIVRYSANANAPQEAGSFSLIPISQSRPLDELKAGQSQQESTKSPPENEPAKTKSISDQTSFLPRSILKTINRIKRELDPEAEEEVIENFRTSKTKTFISLRFILILILIPLLTQQLSKNLLVGPIVDRIQARPESEIFINIDLESEAFEELQRFQSELKFKSMIGLTPAISEDQMRDRITEKATEIAQEYRHRSANAIKNVFADLISLFAFGAVIFSCKREILVLKSFMDEIVYGLSDSAKAFIIILFTDIFVGYHSPHGWEVILEGVSRHLGLPENRSFIFLFIATFPVILDTVLKYWIFRYLNRISPSSVATYRNMNE